MKSIRALPVALLLSILLSQPCNAKLPEVVKAFGTKAACAVLVLGIGANALMHMNFGVWDPARVKVVEQKDAEISKIAAAAQSFHYGYGVLWDRNTQAILDLFTEEENAVLNRVDEHRKTIYLAEFVTALFPNRPDVIFTEDQFIVPTDVTKLLNRGSATQASVSFMHKAIGLAAVLNQLGIRAELVHGTWSRGSGLTASRWFVQLPDGRIADPVEGEVRNYDWHMSRFDSCRFMTGAELRMQGPHFSRAYP